VNFRSENSWSESSRSENSKRSKIPERGFPALGYLEREFPEREFPASRSENFQSNKFPEKGFPALEFREREFPERKLPGAIYIRSKSIYISEGDVESDGSDNSPSCCESHALDNPSSVGEDQDGLEARAQGGAWAPLLTKKLDLEIHEDDLLEREGSFFPTKLRTVL